MIEFLRDGTKRSMLHIVDCDERYWKFTFVGGHAYGSFFQEGHIDKNKTRIQYIKDEIKEQFHRRYSASYLWTVDFGTYIFENGSRAEGYIIHQNNLPRN